MALVVHSSTFGFWSAHCEVNCVEDSWFVPMTDMDNTKNTGPTIASIPYTNTPRTSYQNNMQNT